MASGKEEEGGRDEVELVLEGRRTDLGFVEEGTMKTEDPLADRPRLRHQAEGE